MDLISIIIIIAIISKVVKNRQKAQDKMGRGRSNTWNQAAGQSQSRQYSSGQSEEWKRLARENIEKARRRATEKLREVEQSRETEDKPVGTYQMPKQSTRTTPAYEQLNLQRINAGRMETRNNSILQRAKVNADENTADVTLRTMEAEHNHSEWVSTAEHYHSEDVVSDNMLGKIEDLMIKGYDGNLCFERDFVGEAMDMLSRFSVPSDVPDFSRDDVA